MRLLMITPNLRCWTWGIIKQMKLTNQLLKPKNIYLLQRETKLVLLFFDVFAASAAAFQIASPSQLYKAGITSFR